MPLSEEEQRILAQIEASLRESDPDLAHHVASGSMTREARRRLQMAIVGFVLGVVGSVLLLSVNVVLAFAAFLAAFGALVFVQGDVRDMGRARLSKARSDLRAGVRESMRDPDRHRGRDAGNPFN